MVMVSCREVDEFRIYFTNGLSMYLSHWRGGGEGMGNPAFRFSKWMNDGIIY